MKRGLFTLCVHFSREKEKPNEWPGLTLTMDLPAHDDRLRGFPPPPAPPFKCEGSPSTRRAPQSFMLQLIFKKSFIKGLVGNLFLTREPINTNIIDHLIFNIRNPPLTETVLQSKCKSVNDTNQVY